MSYRAISALVAVVLATSPLSTQADERAAGSAEEQFDTLKKLAGDWVEIGKDGKATDTVVTSFRVTAGGTAIQETIFPGSDHEMITMYHLDGDQLLLTHYCVLGNQPRMRAEPGKEPNAIRFLYVGATNLKNPSAQHMDHATLTLVGPDRFKAEWVSCQDGSVCHEVGLDLMRKPK